ncbi:hypothetical protein BDV96DRAFT_643202 [Lophiotrema nucula]|uniref:Uncharacterized protein n=1 Tax=Lophiotrema nucula TaxID=690887 RepID=A0A6A5ZIF9_9PLEO|nr:hypothetical protein BDV96DRAFT_643202 [Lophiotrema nucula]
MTSSKSKMRRRIVDDISYLLKDSWWPEVQAIFTAWLALAVIFFLLGYYFNKTPFVWHGVSLNTWVSIFSTIMKSLLLFTVSACLSQWKYISFSQKRRKLIDFDLYDGASRGPNGSVSLLWSMQLRSFASIGAIITIISLAIDPFVQQVIGQGQIQKLDIATTIPRATRYAKGAQHRLMGRGTVAAAVVPTIDFSLQSAITAGLTQTKDDISQQTKFKCPGSRCFWDPYLSFGVSSECRDISNSLTNQTIRAGNQSLQGVEFGFSTQRNTTPTHNYNVFVVPNNLYIDDYSTYKVDMVTYATSNRSDTVNFKSNKTLLWSLTVIKRKTDNRPASVQDFEAMECGLSYTIQNISSQVINTTLVEDATVLPVVLTNGSYAPEDGSESDFPDSLWNTTVYYPRNELQLAGNGTKFNISWAAINSIGDFLNTTFVRSQGRQLSATGFYIKDPPQQTTEQHSGGDNGPSSDHDTDSGPQFQPTVMQQIYNTDSIPAMFEALATSMSVNFRTNDANNALALGSMAVTVYKVRWGWITLPLLSVWAGTVFLAVTMYYTMRDEVPLWKSSALAILKVGERTGDTLEREDTIAGMENKAEKTKLLLGGSERRPLLRDGESSSVQFEDDTALRRSRSTRSKEKRSNGEEDNASFISLPLDDGRFSETLPRFSWEREDGDRLEERFQD